MHRSPRSLIRPNQRIVDLRGYGAQDLFVRKLDHGFGKGVVMSMHRQSHDGSSMVAQVAQPEQDERAVLSARPATELASIWGSKIFTLLVMATGVTGLTCFALYVSKRNQEHASGNRTDASTLVRVEVRRVWLPRALVDLAKHEPPTGPIRTHAHLRRVLELRGQEKVWYAMTLWAHDSNGDFIDFPVVRQPYGEPEVFIELLEILSIATGNWPGEPPDRFSAVSFGLVPESLLKHEPRDGIAALLADPTAQRGGLGGLLTIRTDLDHLRP